MHFLLGFILIKSCISFFESTSQMYLYMLISLFYYSFKHSCNTASAISIKFGEGHLPVVWQQVTTGHRQREETRRAVLRKEFLPELLHIQTKVISPGQAFGVGVDLSNDLEKEGKKQE